MTRRGSVCAAVAMAAVLSDVAMPVQASVEPRWTDVQLANFADVILTGRVVDLRSGADPAVNANVVQAGSVAGASDYANEDIGNATGVSVGGLPPGFRAYVRVIAVNACGASAPTGDFSIQSAPGATGRPILPVERDRHPRLRLSL